MTTNDHAGEARTEPEGPNTNKADWDNIGFLTTSYYRRHVAEELRNGPATPSTLAEELDVDIAHVSRALTQMRERDVVELLVPEERKKGRFYGITGEGEQLLDAVSAMEARA